MVYCIVYKTFIVGWLLRNERFYENLSDYEVITILWLQKTFESTTINVK